MSENAPGPAPIMLEAVAAEIEGFVGQAGWDGPTTLFALVPTKLLAADPSAAAVLSPDGATVSPDEIAESAITPIAQEDLPDLPLDEALAQIGWPDEVIGCALSQEIVMLPPSAEADIAEADIAGVGRDSVAAAVARAAEHPERTEARLVVAVLRDGHAAGVLRLRGPVGAGDDLLTGPDLAPNLVAALSATFLS
jgi:hypothetical protein